MLADIQPQSRAGVVPGTVFFWGKSLKQMGHALRGDALPRVAHRNAHAAGHGVQRYRDLPVPGVPVGVGEQVEHHLTDAVLVRQDGGQIVDRPEHQPVPRPDRQGIIGIHRQLDHRPDLAWPPGQAHPPLRNGGHVQQLGHHQGHAVGLGADQVHGLAVLLPQMPLAGLGAVGDDGEGGLQLVGDVGKKDGLGLVRPLQGLLLPAVAQNLQIGRPGQGHGYHQQADQHIRHDVLPALVPDHQLGEPPGQQDVGGVHRQLHSQHGRQLPTLQQKCGEHHGEDEKQRHAAQIPAAQEEDDAEACQEDDCDGDIVAQAVALGAGGEDQQSHGEGAQGKAQQGGGQVGGEQTGQPRQGADGDARQGQQIEVAHMDVGLVCKQGPLQTEQLCFHGRSPFLWE